jgi:hypothetical protein
MFNEIQRQRLRDLSRLQDRAKIDYNLVNAPLERYIRELEASHPELFHTYSPASRLARVFVDQPLGVIPYARAVRGPEHCPYKLIEKLT